MAESKITEKNKAVDEFADDLDSMLNPDPDSEEQSGLIDDDDVIDRLLMDDAFADDGDASSESEEIDKLIGDSLQNDNELVPDFDEFGDDADMFFSDTRMESNDEQADEEVIFDSATSNVHDGADDIQSADQQSRFGDTFDENHPDTEDELEQMTEIDEFSDESYQDHDSDFLLADFDISPDEENEDEETPDEPVAEDQGATGDDLIDDETVFDLPEELDQAVVEELEQQTFGAGQDNQERDFNNDRMVDELMEKLAAVNVQLEQLVKHQHQLKQQLHLTCSQDQLQACLEDIDELKSDQKRSKRNMDAVLNKKPVQAYLAIGIAVFALLVGGGLGMQGYIAKVQLTEVAEYLGQLKEEVRAIPENDAAEKDKLNQRMDELNQANAAISAEIAQVAQSLKGGGADVSGELIKKLDGLNQQDMEIGAAIESLQSKVAAMEKAKNVKLAEKVVKKTIVKKNWSVNLVAFKQGWYAKRKAEEFDSKGVKAQVNKVEIKGETWYRLVVDGFETQYEAAAYAARVKKTLNLDNVWLAEVK